MTIERAIEILDPYSEKPYAPAEWTQAHRMACQALALLRWVPVSERLPEAGVMVLGVASGDYDGLTWLDNDICVVEYDHVLSEWTLADDPEMTAVTVSHWMPLPVLPEGLG